MTGSRGYFVKRGSESASKQRQNVDPRSEVTT
jgi:hypothetical protein